MAPAGELGGRVNEFNFSPLLQWQAVGQPRCGLVTYAPFQLCPRHSRMKEMLGTVDNGWVCFKVEFIIQMKRGAR